MTTVHKKVVRLLYILSFCLLLLGYGCSSSKTIVGSDKRLDYKTLKSFEKIYFEANKQNILANNEKALELFNQALKINPNSHATMYQLSKLYYKLDKFEEALYWSENAVTSSHTFNHWYYGQLGQFYSKFGRYEESGDVFAKMIVNEPDVRDNYIESSSQYYNAKKFDRSVEVLNSMQEYFGIEMESSTRLEYVYSTTDQKDKAVVEMEKLAASDETNVRFKGFLSDAYIEAGEEQKAIVLLKEIIELDPGSGKAYYALHSLYSNSNQDKLAMQQLKKAFIYDDLTLQQKLQSISGYFRKIEKGNYIYDEMDELSNILIDKYPTDLEPYMLKADINGSVGNFETAREYTLKALDVDASEFKLWNKLISANDRLQDPKQQVIDTDRALELFPNMVMLYAAKGYAHLELSQYDEAIEITEEGLDVAVSKAEKTDLLLCISTAYNKLKNFKKADATFDKILKINPYNTTVLNNYSYSLAERKIRLDEADSLISVALNMEPRNPFFLDTKAWVLFAKKEYKEALELLNRCMEIDPKNPEFYIHAKEVFLEMGNTTMANDMQEKINKLNE